MRRDQGSGIRDRGSGMKPGFTIIELLVASMLLGLLVTILTMVFNQSSISWRIGSAMVSDMDDIRDNMAEVREEADNVFAYDGKIYRHVGLWDSRGELHLRSVCGETQSDVKFTKDNGEYQTFAPGILLQKESQLAAKSNRNPWNFSQNTFNVGMAKDQRTIRNYTVNVMSGGPANDVNDWQAIWSFPDDPNEW